MKRGKQQRRVSLFDPSHDDARFRRRQIENATMFIHDNVMIECFDIVSHLMALPEAEPFNEPVDWRALELPTYPHIIKNPMDLGTVKEMLLDSSIDTHDKFAELVRLVFSNAQLFNLAESPIWNSSKYLADEFDRLFEELQARHRIGKFMALNGAGYQSSPASTHTLSAPSSSKRQKARPQSPISPHYPAVSTPPALNYSVGGSEGYDTGSDAEIQQLEDQIRSLEGTIEHFRKEIAEERAKQERAAAEAKNRPPKRIKLSRPIRPVTFEERQDLVYKIPELDQADLPELLDIVRLSTAQKTDSDEIEIDIEKMDDRTFRKVEDFVNLRLASRQQQQMQQQEQQQMDVVAPHTEEQQQAPDQMVTTDAAAVESQQQQQEETAAQAAPVAEETAAAMDVDQTSTTHAAPAAQETETASTEAAPAAVEETPQQATEPVAAADDEPTPAPTEPAAVETQTAAPVDAAEPAAEAQPHAAVETTQAASEPSPAAAESEAFSSETHVPPPVSSTPSEHSEAEDAMDVDQGGQKVESVPAAEGDDKTSASALAALADTSVAVSSGGDAMDTS
eukprot:TRINITY_DN3491_c1_g1_i1.p1 TRINITY_DN3491_c1_g1~~TRINITY_DN3491_c1_g1_i1.p1  ORF type:complete len:565 (-),score=187.74 TRINITY_DN3491_c1_g1_i1:242-1936(-)